MPLGYHGRPIKSEIAHLGLSYLLGQEFAPQQNEHLEVPQQQYHHLFQLPQFVVIGVEVIVVIHDAVVVVPPVVELRLLPALVPQLAALLVAVVVVVAVVVAAAGAVGSTIAAAIEFVVVEAQILVFELETFSKNWCQSADKMAG